MKKLLLILLLIVLGWEVFWTLMGVKPLFPWQLQKKLSQAPTEVVLLDVRTPWEFQWFHLPGAQNVPFEKGLPNNLTIPRNKTVVVICMTGHRSPLVAYRLLKDGYPRAYNLIGGMAGWEAWKWVASALTGESPLVRNEAGMFSVGDDPVCRPSRRTARAYKYFARYFRDKTMGLFSFP